MAVEGTFGRAVVVVVWASYCALVTAIGADDHFELTLFLVYVPAQIALGLLVPRWPSVLGPPLLTVLLGWLAYQAACPCREDGVGFFCVLWIMYFAIPGLVAVGAGVALGEWRATRRKVAPR